MKDGKGGEGEHKEVVSVDEQTMTSDGEEKGDISSDNSDAYSYSDDRMSSKDPSSSSASSSSSSSS